MVSDPEWQFSQRWAQIIELDVVAAELLDAKDRELEAKLLAGYGGSCTLLFEYPYRWAQIIREDPLTQVSMLTTRDVSLANAVSTQGGCPLELPYQWVEILPLMLDGDVDGFMLAEENDRVIESRFAGCSCAVGITTGASYSDTVANSDLYTFPADGTITEFRIQASDCTPNCVWYFNITGGTEVDIYSVTGGDFDCVYDLVTETLTGTFPGDTTVFDTVSTSVTTGQQLRFNVSSDGPTFATPNPFQLTVVYSEAAAVLDWFNI